METKYQKEDLRDILKMEGYEGLIDGVTANRIVSFKLRWLMYTIQCLCDRLKMELDI